MRDEMKDGEHYYESHRQTVTQIDRQIHRLIDVRRDGGEVEREN